MKNNDGQLQAPQPWREFFEAAVLELDLHVLPKRIADAQRAIAERTSVLLRSHSHDQLENEALTNARIALDSLKRVHKIDGQAA